MQRWCIISCRKGWSSPSTSGTDDGRPAVQPPVSIAEHKHSPCFLRRAPRAPSQAYTKSARCRLSPRSRPTYVLYIYSTVAWQAPLVSRLYAHSMTRVPLSQTGCRFAQASAVSVNHCALTTHILAILRLFHRIALRHHTQHRLFTGLLHLARHNELVEDLR